MRNERAGGGGSGSAELSPPAEPAWLRAERGASRPPPTDYNTKGNLENEYQHNRNNRKHHAP